MDKKLLDALAAKAEQRKADKSQGRSSLRSAVSCLILLRSGIPHSWMLMRHFSLHESSRHRC